jgi:hypothetical protein
VRRIGAGRRQVKREEIMATGLSEIVGFLAGFQAFGCCSTTGDFSPGLTFANRYACCIAALQS